jgi:hypothetical protein
LYLITFEGWGFSNFEDESLSCLFISKDTASNPTTLTAGIILKSPILKENTVCDKTDYDCMYWQTSYQFSNTQISCYTPIVPYETRLRIKSSTQFIVYLETSYSKYTCQLNNDCLMSYDPNYTPEIFWIYPQHVYIGSQIQLRIRPRSTLGTSTTLSEISTNRAVSNLLNIKVGKYNCIPQTMENGIPDATYIKPSDISMDSNFGLIYCLINEGLPETITKNGFMLNYYTGLSSVKEYMYKSELNQEDQYIFKIFPKIDSISTNLVSPFGETRLIIKGKGFSDNEENLQVYLDDIYNPCKINKISLDTIECTTSKLTDSLMNKISNFTDTTLTYIGSPGLTLRYFNNSNCDSVWNIKGFPHSGFIKQDIILETSTYSMQGYNYAEFIDGYFKAPYTAQYRFYTTSDDGSRIYLTIDNQRKTLVNFNSWTSFMDYTFNSQQYSEWVSLKKGEFYYLEIVHCQGSGADHLIIGVEVKNSESNLISKRESFNQTQSKGEKKFLDYKNDPINNVRLLEENETPSNSQLPSDNILPLPKTIDRTLKVTIKPNILIRDFYEMRTSGLDTNYTILCKNPPDSPVLFKSLSFNNNISPSEFISKFGNFIGDKKLVVRRLFLNDVGSYFDSGNEPFYSDASYDKLKSFPSFYYVNKTLFSDFSNTGIKYGYSFFFYIDSPLSERKVRLETDCYYRYDPGSNANPLFDTKLLNFDLKQKVSNPLAGYYQLKFGNFSTEQIQTTTNSAVYDSLNKIPVLTNKVVIIGSNFINSEIFYYHIRYTFPLNEDIYKDELISVNFNAVTGGFNDTCSVIIEEINSEKSLNFFPIPSDFLFTRNLDKKPQIRVISNNIEAVCLPSVCGFSTIDEGREIINYNYNSDMRRLNITISKAFYNEETSYVKVYLGDQSCEDLKFENFSVVKEDPVNNTTLTVEQQNIICKINQEVGGIYKPKVISKYGLLKINSLNSKEITIPMILNDINPKSAPYVGGTTLTISGDNFPGVIDDDLIITVASANCIPISSNYKEIICTLTPKLDINSTEPLAIKYKSVSVVDSNHIFKFDNEYHSPNLISIIPNSVSPGEKQFITVKISEDISTKTKQEDLLVTISKKDENNNSPYTIRMNVFKFDKDTLTVKFPGGPPGNYKLTVKLNKELNIQGELPFEITHEIISISPNIGSVKGGTTLHIKGKNFLKTQQNQLIMIDNIMCNYINNTVTDVFCITSPVKDLDQIEKNLQVSVDHVIQYSSVCKDTVSNCSFIYSEKSTPELNYILNLNNTSLDALNAFRINDYIEISGNNFIPNYSNETMTQNIPMSFPDELIFDWGKDKINL